VGYASKQGRARINPSSPEAAGCCDRCGFIFSFRELSFQYDWRGATLQNLRILVCRPCLDTPQEQLRAIVVPADPTPIVNARVQDFTLASSDNRVTSGQNTTDPRTGIPVPGGNTRITQTNDIRSTQQTGEAPFGTNQLPGTDPNAVTYRTVSNAQNNGSGLIRLTINTTNGMITGQRVVIQEVGGVSANGNWAISVVDINNIDLQSSTFSGTYTSGGYVINNPSLPYGFAQVPRTGSL